MSKKNFLFLSSLLFLILYIGFLYNSFYFHKDNVKNFFKTIKSKKELIIDIHKSERIDKINYLNLKDHFYNPNFFKVKNEINYKISLEFYDLEFVNNNLNKLGLKKNLEKDITNIINSERFLFLKKNYVKFMKVKYEKEKYLLFKFQSDNKTIFYSIFLNSINNFIILSAILLLLLNYFYSSTLVTQIKSLLMRILNFHKHLLKLINKIKNLLSYKLNKRDKLNLVTSIIFIGFISSFLYYYVIESIIYPPSPDIFTPFHNIINIFCDYYSIDNYFHLNGFNSSKNNYFPGSLLIIQILKLLTFSNPYIGVKIILTLYISFIILFLNSFLKEIKILEKILFIGILTFCSYPFLFTFHTANFEGFVFIGLALSFLFYCKRKHYLTGFFIGFASSLKIYPLIFLLVFARISNIKKLSLGIFSGLSIMFFLPFILSSFIFPYGNIVENLNQWIVTFPEGLIFYKNHMVLGWSGVHFGHSILNSLWLILGPSFNLNNFYGAFIIILAILLSLCCIKLIKMKKVLFKFIFCLTTVCLLAPTSTDYKLIHFFIPLVFMINSRDKNKDSIKILILISLLMISKSYIYFYDNIYANTNTIFNTFILLYIGLLSLRIDKLYGIESFKNAIKKFF